MLALRVLGGFQVVLDGRDVPELTAQRTRAALLVLLAMDGSTTRERVVALLWPDHNAQKARHALSQTLHRLRATLGEEWLETEGERLATSPSVQLDAQRFETLIDTGDYESALNLYHGGFLAGWFLGESAAFDLWADQQRARLERLHRRACREAIRTRRERGDLAVALGMAQQWAEIDPLEDEAQHRLIELLAESGRRADALRQFDVYARLLAGEDLTPLEETVELVARLRQATDVGPLPDPELSSELATDTSGPIPNADPIPGAAHADGLSSHPPQPGVALPPRAGIRFSLSKRMRNVVLAATALAALGAAVLLGRRFAPGARERRAALPPGGRLVLADFGNDTRDSLVAGVVTEALRIDLERHLHSSLADPAEIASVLDRMRRDPETALESETAREVALRAGIPAMIDGKVGAVGPGFVLEAWVVAAESGRILDAVLATARDSTELLSAIEDLSRQLRAIIRPSLADLPQPTRLAQVTTFSLAALRKYGQAVRTWHREGDGVRAVRLLQEATRLDTTFAMAYRAEATVLTSIGGPRSAWVQALSNAYRYRDHLSERERYLTIASYHHVATGDLGEAIRAYQNLLEIDSTDVATLNNLGVIYRDLRDFPRAEVFLRRCVNLDTLALMCAINLGGVVHALGHPEEARRIAQQTARRFPDNPFANTQLGWIAATEHDYAAADSLFANLRRFNLPNPGALELWLGELDMVQGRVHEARTHLQRAYETAGRNTPVTAVAARIAEAWMELEILRDTTRALATMEATQRDPVFLALDVVDVPYLELADFFLAAARPDRANTQVEAFLANVPAELRRPEDRMLYVIRGVMAMQRGRFEEALDAFRIADTHPGSPFLTLQYLGSLYASAQRPDSAIAAYERYLSMASLDRLTFDAALLPGILQRLAALHEAAGHTAQAASYYMQLADLWQDADPALQPRAVAVRRRAQALLAQEPSPTPRSY